MVHELAGNTWNNPRCLIASKLHDEAVHVHFDVGNNDETQNHNMTNSEVLTRSHLCYDIKESGLGVFART